MTDRYHRSRELFARARQVIPGGIYGHVAPATTVPSGTPFFAQAGHGCRYRDVDGHEYIDLMCGYGPMLLGYHHPEVEEAVATARARGAAFNHPTELTVTLAETLVRRIDFADWAVFAKNGSDLTTWAVQVAREATGRRKVVKVAGAYHGSHAWCSPGHGGLLPEDRQHVLELPWNDVAALESLAATHGADLATVVLTPFHHPAHGDSVLPSPEFVAAVEALRKRHGCLLVLDDVRCFPRLHLGGSHRAYGWQPDLAIYCKAIGNGHPLAACVGRGDWQVPASRVFLTGSYWHDPAPLAAALKVLEISDREDIPARLEATGRRLVEGLLALGKQQGLALEASGPFALPYVRVGNDPGFQRTQDLCVAAAAEGVFLHPHHNWFMSLAHTNAEIDEALTRLGRAVAQVSAQGS